MKDQDTISNSNDPDKPGKDIPAKPDKDPDPTRPHPGGNEPEKNDPARIEEPTTHGPTRIDEPPEPKPDGPLKA